MGGKLETNITSLRVRPGLQNGLRGHRLYKLRPPQLPRGRGFENPRRKWEAECGGHACVLLPSGTSAVARGRAVYPPPSSCRWGRRGRLAVEPGIELPTARNTGVVPVRWEPTRRAASAGAWRRARRRGPRRRGPRRRGPRRTWRGPRRGWFPSRSRRARPTSCPR